MTRPQAILTAREMWDNGDGWSIPEIKRYLADRGQTATVTTIKMWVDDAYCQERRAALRERHRLWARGKRGSVSFKVLDADALKRMGDLLNAPAAPAFEATPKMLLALRVEDGLTYSAISKVAKRFLGLDMTPQQARYRLNVLGAPKNPNKARAAREQNQFGRVA